MCEVKPNFLSLPDTLIIHVKRYVQCSDVICTSHCRFTDWGASGSSKNSKIIKVDEFLNISYNKVIVKFIL